MKEITPRTRVMRLKKLRNFLAALPARKFDMGGWCLLGNNRTLNRTFQGDGETAALPIEKVRECGTRACIAGWTVILFERKNAKVSYDGIESRARQLLGLNYDVASDLFYGNNMRGHGSSRGVTARDQAVRVLDTLIANKGTCVYTEEELAQRPFGFGL